MPKKIDPAVKARCVRQVLEHLPEYPESHWVSFRLISQDGNDGQVHERDA